LTSAGVLAVNDSGGAAVFTFDASAGAEFTKPLTLGTNGGIYQGTGTFSVPTTGLKISNSGGKGMIEGYNTNIVQWYANTDGRLYAGAGEVALDADGVKMVISSSDAPSGGSVRWYTDEASMIDGSPHLASIYSYAVGSYNELHLRGHNGDTRNPKVILEAYTGGGTSASITAWEDISTVQTNLDLRADSITIDTTGAAGFSVQSSTVFNESGSTETFRIESDTEASMFYLVTDLIYIGGQTNGLKIEKGGVVSFIGTGKIKDGTNIPLDTTTGTKIGTGTTQKLGFWNATPIVRPSAFTQTYSTATRTHANLTYSAPAAYGAGANGYSTAAMASAVHAAVIALAADLTNLKQVVNALIDDHQAIGLAG